MVNEGLDKILDIMLSNQNIILNDISNIKTNIATITHRLEEGDKRFDILEKKVEKIDGYCQVDGCRSPLVANVIDHFSRHVGDSDKFFEFVNKQYGKNADRAIAVLDDMIKKHISGEELKEDLKRDSIKGFLGGFIKFGKYIIGLGIAAAIVILLVSVMKTLGDLAPILDAVKQLQP